MGSLFPREAMLKDSGSPGGGYEPDDAPRAEREAEKQQAEDAQLLPPPIAPMDEADGEAATAEEGQAGGNEVSAQGREGEVAAGAELAVQEEGVRLFRNVDAIDFETFACMSINQGIPRAKLRQIFDDLDVDGSGGLDVVEFARYSARKEEHDLRPGLRVEIVGAPLSADKGDGKKGDYNGMVGHIVRRGLCSKWIVAVEVKKAKDKDKKSKKQRDKAPTPSDAKPVKSKQTVLLKLLSENLKPLDAKPAQLPSAAPHSPPPPRAAMLATPPPPPPAQTPVAPPLELISDRASTFFTSTFEAMREQAARQAEVRQRLASAAAQASPHESAGEGEDEACSELVCACLLSLALARYDLDALRREEAIPSSDTPSTFFTSTFEAVREQAARGIPGPAPGDAAADAPGDAAADARAQALANAREEVVRCEQQFYELLRRDWGAGKGAIEARRHWTDVGVTLSKLAPFVVLASSHELSVSAAHSSLFEVRGPHPRAPLP